jgi:elongation factor G
MAFKICSAICFKEAARKAKPVLLEPVMAVEVVVPEEYMGTVNGYLIASRGQPRRHRVDGRHDGSSRPAFRCQRNVRLCERSLRSATQGRGSFHDALLAV